MPAADSSWRIASNHLLTTRQRRTRKRRTGKRRADQGADVEQQD